MNAFDLTHRCANGSCYDVKVPRDAIRKHVIMIPHAVLWRQTPMGMRKYAKWLTIVTLALRRSMFSSWRDLHFSLKVSSSIFNTLFSCCKDARRFFSSSRRKGEMRTEEVEEQWGAPPSVSLSLALSAITDWITLRGWWRTERLSATTFTELSHSNDSVPSNGSSRNGRS